MPAGILEIYKIARLAFWLNGSSDGVGEDRLPDNSLNEVD